MDDEHSTKTCKESKIKRVLREILLEITTLGLVLLYRWLKSRK